MPKQVKEISALEQKNSEEVEEIIGRKPAWILKWGIVIISLIVIGVIVACYYIRYPQTILTTISITSDNPPADLIAKRTGVLDSVFCYDGDFVKQNQAIALIASTAEYEDIIKIRDILITGDESFILNQDWSSLSLGDIQSSWISYLKAVAVFDDYKTIDRIGKRKELIRRQLEQEGRYQERLLAQRQSLVSSVEIEKDAIVRDSILYSVNALSKDDYDNRKSQLLAKENSLLGFDASLASVQLSQIQLEQELTNLDIQRNEESVEYTRAINQARQLLLHEIELWLEQYAFLAPRDGIVSLHNIWSQGQRVVAGEIIASISPTEERNMVGRMKVPSSGFGKVKVGQDVIIKLNGFPYLEFGIIKGKIRSISSVPENNDGEILYSVDVSFDQGLVSSYKLEIPYVQDMDGIAEIITDDMRLLEHFIRPIRDLFINRISDSNDTQVR